MSLDPIACHRAHAAKDRRFDGKFFVCVSSTGIYCRPVCPVKTPKAENCSYVRHAAQAEALGYRPCLRCRPELAPGHSVADVADRRAKWALAQIESQSFDGDMAALVGRSGVSERQLRRVVKSAFGIPPKQIASTHRRLTAKRLISDTSMPIGEVAVASGYGSLRRFNDEFVRHYGLSPSGIRKSGKRPSEGMVTHLGFRPPYDWDGLIGFFRHRAVSGVESIDGGYARTVRVAGKTGWVRVEHAAERHCLKVTVSESLLGASRHVLHRLRRQFDIDSDPETVSAVLAPLGCAGGIRLPGAFDPFETAVRAILGQQVSVAAATTLAGRIAERFGGPLVGAPYRLTRVFPVPEDLAALSGQEVASVGLPVKRAQTLVLLARAIVDGQVDLSGRQPEEETKAALLAVPGIGPWTVEYLAMRGLADPDAWPAGDLGLKRAVGAGNLDPEAFRPYRSYAALMCWRDGAAGAA